MLELADYNLIRNQSKNIQEKLDEIDGNIIILKNTLQGTMHLMLLEQIKTNALLELVIETMHKRKANADEI